MTYTQDPQHILQSGYRYALSLVHQALDAEDLVHDAWLKAYPKYGTKLTQSLFFTTIRNVYIDQYRRNQLAVFEAFDEETYKEIEIDTKHDISSEDLDQALAKLNSNEREAIFLNIVEGYSTQEIADKTDRSRNTVLSHIHRGKRKLVHTLTALINRRNPLQG
ncbi:MAG: RNA polymerase sigma factor [Candidatus Latescibacteria bacterium]|jgi:RNA polymerase sigma-70 factor, ECF subfamily|nr:RNA polymerase sigma factor [Candidatus Latescibacterota bacterium]